MIDWENRILTNVRTLLWKEFGKNVKVVSVVNDSPPSFPTVCVSTVASNSVAGILEPSEGEQAIYCGISVTAYSKNSKQECKNLIAIANKAMFMMGFERGYGPIIIVGSGEAQSMIQTMNAKYERYIGGEDEIYKFDEE